MSKISLLYQNLKDARKNRKYDLISFYGTLLGMYNNNKVENPNKDDDEIIEKAADKMAKDLQENKDEDGNLTQEAANELELIKEFQSETLSEDEHREIIQEVLKEESGRSFGPLMSKVMLRLGKKGNGKMAKNILNEELQKGN